MREFSAGKAEKIGDYIVEFSFEKDIEIDERMSIEILSIIQDLTFGKNHALLYNFNKCNVLLSEIARKVSGVRNYNNSHLIARALVSQSFTSNLESNYYIKNNKPSAETLLFQDRNKAIEWLTEKANHFLSQAK